jgi:tetraprenyl-beta-curcumene synthase
MGQGGVIRPAGTFARAARRFWAEVYPLIRRERRRWQLAAEAIPDPALREDALHTQRTKWGHSEGAAAFAVLVPRDRRAAMVRMAIAYELMIDYLDTTSERPVADLFANTRHLHRALDQALGAGDGADDFYALHPHGDDGGYLAAHVATCREAFTALPSFAAICGPARRNATLYAESQSLHHAASFGEDGVLPEALRKAPTTAEELARHPDMLWWELLAAGGSSLPVLSLMAAGTRPGLAEADAETIRAAYYPWPCALHILLDGLVDWAADSDSGEQNQIDHYESPRAAAGRLALMAARSRRLVGALPAGDTHLAILDGLGGYYLATPHVWEAESREVARSVLGALGPMARPARTVHRLKRAARL